MIGTKIEPKKTASLAIRVLHKDKEDLKVWVAENTDLNFSEFIRESIALNVSRINKERGIK